MLLGVSRSSKMLPLSVSATESDTKRTRILSLLTDHVVPVSFFGAPKIPYRASNDLGCKRAQPSAGDIPEEQTYAVP